jgi:hypothetical protein
MSANVCAFEDEGNNFYGEQSMAGREREDISIRPSFPLIFIIRLALFSLSLFSLSPDKPICRSEQKRIYGVARNEAAEILCEVDAYPPPESFKWSFNNTAETFEMPQSDYRIHSSQASTLSYTPVKVQ